MERQRVSTQLIAALVFAGVCVVALLFGIAALFDGAAEGSDADAPILASALSFPGDELGDDAFLDGVGSDLAALDSQRAAQSLASWRQSVGDDVARSELADIARTVCLDATGGAELEQIRSDLAMIDHAEQLGGQGPIVTLAASVVLCPSVMEDAIGG